MSKKNFALFRSFRVKVTVVLVLLLCLYGFASTFFIYKYSVRAQLNQIRDKLMIVAQAIAFSIDADTLQAIPLNKEGVDTPQYKAIEEKLVQIKKIAPSLAYIYILKTTQNPGFFEFIIDIHPGAYRADVVPASPGDLYDGTCFPELAKGFSGPAADRTMASDKWGVFLSGYAPIRDSKNRVVAVLGIDMSAADVYHIQKKVQKFAILFFMAGLFLSLLLGTFLSTKVTAPIGKLTEGIRHIASGDLRHRVEVKGQDEISELADAFNKMAANLLKTRHKLVEYFYRVGQSLIRVMEARDPYTKGHSDRVAEYSEKIAQKMGFPKDRIELLKESALLHDIGKLGIQEAILNKLEVFTEEEKNIIQKHPAIGEDILKPVSPDKEMLAVVRGHHERYDGKGYPDGLSGDNIDILAAIVAVADSYDAMTSHRPYRKNLTTDEAIAQLKNNSGLQFNPKIVDVFVKVLKEGG